MQQRAAQRQRLPSAHFDQNPLRVRDPSAESVQAFEELLAESRNSPWSLNALRPDLASAEALAADAEQTVAGSFAADARVSWSGEEPEQASALAERWAGAARVEVSKLLSSGWFTVSRSRADPGPWTR